MEFDKSKILTVVTADQAKIGQKGWFASNVETLSRLVLEEQPKELLGFDSNNAVHAFKTAFQNHALFYPAPEPTPVFNSLKEYVLAELDWVKKNGVWAGAKVRVVSGFTKPNEWEGWLNSDDFAHPPKLVGGEFIVKNVVPKGINLFGGFVRRKDELVKDWFTVPFYALEVVEPIQDKTVFESAEYLKTMNAWERYVDMLEPTVPTYPDFKVGDRVEVIKDCFPLHSGTIGVVTHSDPDSAMMGIKALDYDHSISKRMCKLITYRPFANAEEFKPYRDEWFRVKNGGGFDSVRYYDNNGVKDSTGNFITYQKLFEAGERENGEPCGVREEI
mgnify:CR=1 FL=1